MSGWQRRRVVSVGAARGVLTLGERGWVVANDAEVRLLEALRAERVARIDRDPNSGLHMPEGLLKILPRHATVCSWPFEGDAQRLRGHHSLPIASRDSRLAPALATRR